MTFKALVEIQASTDFGEGARSGASDARLFMRDYKQPDSISTLNAIDAVRDKHFERGLSGQQWVRTMSSLASAPSLGGNTVPIDVLGEILMARDEYGAAAALFRSVPMAAKKVEAPTITAAPVPVVVGELENIVVSDFQFGRIVMLAHKIAHIGAAAHEALEDAPVLVPGLVRSYGMGLAYVEDTLAFRGNGTAQHGSHLGLLRTAGHELSLAAGKTSVTQVHLDDLGNLTKLIPASKRKLCTWALAPRTVQQLRSIKLIDGSNIISVDREALFLHGYRVNEVAALEDEPDVPGAPFALFGDFRAALFGVRREMKFELLPAGLVTDSDGQTILVNAIFADALLLRISERVGFAVDDADAFAVLKTAAA